MTSQLALVTGATGFIGRRLVEILRVRGVSVRCMVRRPAPGLEALGAECVRGDLRDPESLARAVEGVGVVYHLAALLRVPWVRAFAQVNAHGVGALAHACASRPTPPRLVLVSTLAAAGPARDGDGEEHRRPRPVSRYGRAKLMGEQAAARYAADVPLTVVRPPVVIGPRDTSFLPMFQMVSRGRLVAPQRSPQRLALIHVDDLSDLLIRAAEGECVPAGVRTPRGRGVYHAGCERCPELTELGGLLAEALEVGAPRVVRLPFGVTLAAGALAELGARALGTKAVFNLDKAREAGAGSWTATVEKAREQLGYAPGATLAERLGETARWYRAQGWMGRG